VSIEDYLRGIQELPEFWPGASLEAQAVVSRSLAIFRLVEHGQASDFDTARMDLCACHILDNDPEQAYGGYTAELGHPFWQGRVGASSGQVITRNNQVIWARFTSSTGGRTESNDATGGEYLPYLVSVDDAASLSGPADNPYSSWEVGVGQSELGSRFGFLWLTDATVTSKYESGTAQTVRLDGIIAGRPATVTTTGSAVRDALGLRSSYFDIDVTPRFADVQVSHPFAGEILGLSELGITTGCTETDFCPSDPVTREQMAAFLTRALTLPSE
jgi:SpoIID/LytB domain protein